MYSTHAQIEMEQEEEEEANDQEHKLCKIEETVKE